MESDQKKLTVKEYWNVADKSEWGDGPWQNEPDKIQWVDEETGLDCLMVRNNFGAWCGYVGVDENHPWHGRRYDACIEPGCDQNVGYEDYDNSCNYYHEVSARISVHGGLTFSDSCHEPTQTEWILLSEKIQDKKLREQADRFPDGDAARRVQELAKQIDMSYDEWTTYQQARRICHIPGNGRPDNVWWFGFDCAHAWDMVPGMYKWYRERSEQDVYRDREYVEQQCQELAKQLKLYG